MPQARSGGMMRLARSVGHPSAPCRDVVVGATTALLGDFVRRLLVFAAGLFLLCSASLPTTQAESARQAAPPTELRSRLADLRSTIGSKLPDGSWLSIEHTIDVSERVAGGFPEQSKQWAARAKRMLDAAAEGRDAAAEARGEIRMRGYRSPISEHVQGYAIYTPKDYDPAKKYPLLVMLHGGSANGNLFLGVVLGNNMSWLEYDKFLWNEYEPRWSPDFIVVAPDGFGHVMWRWMGEQDVLDVVADVQKHYSVDEERIALGGLSNGGVGAYNIGMRHASRFSIVTAIAGAPSWLQYSGGRLPEQQTRMMQPMSGMQLAENAINTDFRYYHGHTDGGPMKPKFVHELTEHIGKLGVPFKETWFDAGHDLLYLVHRHGKIYNDLLAPARRKKNPAEVRILTGDYRANRQHWVTVTRIAGYPQLARVRAVVNTTPSADRIDVEAQHVRAFELDLAQAPIANGTVRIHVNGQEVCSGTRATLGDVAKLVLVDGKFKTGSPDSAAFEKKPKLSGPITDSYFDGVVHVYGTQDPAATAALKRTAERSANGSPLWLWRVKQRVLADSEVTDELMKTHHVVLYATPKSNALLERMAGKLPVSVDPNGVSLGHERYEGRGIGVKLIYPNPLATDRYVIVQAAPTTAGVDGGRNLPDFLPDYVVYDATTTASRPRLTFPGNQKPRAMGYFDDAWQLPMPGPEHAKRVEPSANRTPTVLLAATTRAEPIFAPVPSAAITADAATHATIDPGGVTPTLLPPMPASQVAKMIARRVKQFPSYRAKIPFGSWLTDPLATWSIPEDRSCLRKLAALGVKARAYELPLLNPVPTPVEIEPSVNGVRFHMVHTDRTLLMSCEMASRLPELVALLKQHAVKAVDVMSAYRDHPWASFHTLGLALDISRFKTAHGPLVVKTDFIETPEAPTCEGPVPEGLPEPAQRLRAIACALAGTRRFSSVLTPNYNVGHRDHFHIDIRPNDDRLFVR
jgi:poly(3-hydroxybutyrate) depolymerase